MIQLLPPTGAIKTSLVLSGSKSISNRLLLLNAVLKADTVFENMSTAEDTQLMQQALRQVKESHEAVIDIHHAGTDLRFLTAFLSVTPGVWTLTGSARLKERPVGELVTALRLLGADIHYLEKENFAPLKISGKNLEGGSVTIEAGVSSQFISALLLIAPAFKNGLQLQLQGKAVSQPYINMTIALLQQYGISVQVKDNYIEVFPYSPVAELAGAPSAILHVPSYINIESDWSSASYWYSLCALSKNSEIELSSFNEHSLQADAVLPTLYDSLGVSTVFKNNKILLSNKNKIVNHFKYDFTACPDIAQTLAVTCFGLGIPAELTGLQTLKLKETDRILALKTELEKLGATVTATNNSVHITPPFSILPFTPDSYRDYIQTYNDHRMAMSFAPLALRYPGLTIKNPEVVNKSYPGFWEDLISVGFNVTSLP